MYKAFLKEDLKFTSGMISVDVEAGNQNLVRPFLKESYPQIVPQNSVETVTRVQLKRHLITHHPQCSLRSTFSSGFLHTCSPCDRVCDKDFWIGFFSEISQFWLFFKKTKKKTKKTKTAKEKNKQKKDMFGIGNTVQQNEN